MQHDEVFLLGWDNSTNAAGWIIDIVLVSGNQVDVQMHDVLPRWDSAINAIIAGIRLELLVQNISGSPE